MSKLIPTILAAVIGVVGYLFIGHLTERYSIAIDGQSYERCLPFWLYVFDSEFHDAEIKKGAIVKVNPKFDRDERITTKKALAKVILGSSGDRINITSGKLYINDRYFSDLHLLEALSKNASDYESSYTVPDGQYFVGGTSPGSYDSRYWGLVNKDEISGVGYAVL